MPEGIRIGTEFPADRVIINADRNQMLIAFSNILRNGLEAMPQGGTLSIKIRAKDNRAETSFTDTGAGIPPENMDKLFRLLFTTKLGGTGFGLPITKKIIEAHDGTINITSIVGVGTTVSVSLPLFDVDSENNGK
jgi:signal transduction histidine kinase